MPVNDGSNISIAGPRGGLTTTDPFQQASKLFSAMRRASGGGGGTNAAVAASLGLPPNAKIDWMLDPQSGKYVPVVGGTDELRKYNLAAAKQRRAIEAINSEKGAGIRAKLEGFGGKSAEKQASILNDIRTNDIPKLSKDAQVDGSDLITYGLADYSRMQKENAANVAKTGTGDILWDSLRIGARNFMDSVADIFSDSNEQLARANLRQQYIRDIQDNNAFLRNRALQQQEGAGFLDRFGWGELAATTGEFLAENAPVLAATALTGGAAGLAARGIGAAAANVGRASMLGSAIGGGLTGMPTQLGSAINEIAADNKMTEDQKLQALDEAYAPSLKAGAALGAVVMPFGQYISRGIGSGLARAGVGNSNVAKMVRSRRAGEALPTGTNNWDEAMAMARRNDILAENEAIANQRLYRGMLGRRLRDSAIEGSLLSGASQMATNAAVGNSLMENVGPATIGGAIGGALFTPFNRRTAMGVPDDVIGQRTAERQKLVDLFAARNAAMGGDARSLDDQTIGAMEAWDALAGARGADVFSGANPMTPEQREAYLRQQSYDDLLLNRMVAHEATVRERERLAAEAAQARQDEARRVADFWRQHSDTLLQAEFTPRSIFDVMPDAIPNTTPDPVLPRARVTTPLDAEWNRMERERAIARDAARIRSLINEANIPSRMEYGEYAGRDIFNTAPYNLDRIAAEDAARRSLLAQQATSLRDVWNLDPVRRAIETPRGYARSTPDLDAEWRDEAIRRINNSILGRSISDSDRMLELPAELPVHADGSPIAMGPYVVPTPQGIALPAGTGRTTAGDAWIGPSLMDAVASSQEAPTPYKYTRVMNNAERSALRQGREGVARTLGAIRDVRQKDLDFGNAVLGVKQAWDATDPIALDPRYRFYVRSTPDLDAEWAANEAVLRQIQEQVPAETRSSLLGTLRGVRNQRNDDVLRQEFRNRGYTRRTPDLDAEWAAATESRDRQAIDRLYENTIGRNARVNDHLAIPEETPRRADGSPIPAGENPATVKQRTNEARQRVVDTLAALNERRKGTERIINTAIAQEYYFNRVRDQQFRRDFTIYEGEVLLENNPGVLPTNNYLPENVAAVVENLGEPRIAETMLDGTPATDQRPKPQRPYTKAITYVSSDDALRKFTGKLRGRESMIPRDVREEQMGWMNDILAAGTGKGRISAQGVLAKDVRDTLDKIVDAQTVDSAMRLDELLLTRLRGSEDTSLFNRAQRAAMQYVRNRIYANMDDYAYQNKLGRYGEIDANTPENTDPTGGGGSPTSGMGRTESAGAEPTVDNNLSNDSGGPTNSAGVSEATAGQLPDSTVTDSAAVEERGDAGTETPDSGEDTTLEGDSAATSAQQQAADGKRDTGDAARVDAATNPRTGSDRVEGSAEQGDDRNAADTGSNGQSGSRAEPEDGESIDSSIEEDPSMYRSHTGDWPYENLDEELAARDAENVRIDRKKRLITIDPLTGDDTGGRLKITDDLRVEEETSKDDPVYPTIVVTLQNASGEERVTAYRFVSEGKRGAWVHTDTVPDMSEETSLEEIPGISVQGSTGKIQIDARKLPSMAKDFEGRVKIELFDDGMNLRNTAEFPFQPHDFDSSRRATETPREVLNGAYKGGGISRDTLINATPTEHFPREFLGDPTLTSASYNIDSSVGDNARVVLTIGDSRYPNVTYAHVVVDADRSKHQLTAEQRNAIRENEIAGYKKYEIDDDISGDDDDLPFFMESGSNNRIDISFDSMPNNMREAIRRRGRFTVTGRVIDADGNDIIKPESATYFVHGDEDSAIQQAEKLGYYNKTPEQTPATVEQTPTVEPKGLSSAEEIIERQNNPDVVPTEGVDPESNEALSWAAQQEGNRSHVEDDDPNSMITPSESEYGSEYENLTDGAKEYTARNIRSNTSKTQISVSTKDANTVGNVKVFPGYIRVTVRRPYSRTSERLQVDFNIGVLSKMYSGYAVKSNRRDGGYTWSLNEARPEKAESQQIRDKYLKEVEINNFSGDKRIINRWEEPPQSDLNEYLYIHLDDWDQVNHYNGTAPFSVNVTTGYDRVYSLGKVMHFEGTVERNKLTNDNTMQAATQGTLRTLISANAEPTKQNIEAAQKVVKESGSIDAREAFLEDTAATNATITAKDSLKDSAKKKLQKAKQELPQLPIDTPAPTTESPSVFSERFSRTIADMEQQYTRNGHSLDNFIKGAASSGASAKRIIAKRNASDASWREDLRDDMAETAARLGIMRSTGLFGEVKRGSPLARKEEFFANNNIPLIEPNSEMAQHLKEYFGAMPARERKITQAIDYVLRDPTAQKMDIINHPERSVC